VWKGKEKKREVPPRRWNGKGGDLDRSFVGSHIRVVATSLSFLSTLFSQVISAFFDNFNIHYYHQTSISDHLNDCNITDTSNGPDV
jgi:hypothetical protein